MKNSRLVSSALAALLALGALNQTQIAAKADTGSTSAIAVGAAAIVGALLYDGNRRPYYVRNDRRYYVTQSEANYYRGHHRVAQRPAYVARPVSHARYHDNARGNARGHAQAQHGHDRGHH